MTNEKKMKLFNATLDAEEEFLNAVRKNERNPGVERYVSHEIYCRGAYNALYNLCCTLHMEQSYLDWANTPEEE